MDVGTPAAIERIQRVLAEEPSTEAELRALRAQADGWARVLEGRVRAGERRLRELTTDPASSLAAIAGELRTVDPLRRELVATLELLDRLDERARDLRSVWLSAGRVAR